MNFGSRLIESFQTGIFFNFYSKIRDVVFDKKFFVEITETFLTSVAVLFVVYVWIAMPEMVHGASMEPNFYTGERILVERLTSHFKDFERGEVVVLHPPRNDDIDYIKRIIGIPGDTVKIMDCSVYIVRDGVKFELNETYLSEGTCTSDGPRLREGHSVKLEEGQYVVLGDNRGESADSRVFGLVEEDRILGRVVFRFWPFSKLGFL